MTMRRDLPRKTITISRSIALQSCGGSTRRRGLCPFDLGVGKRGFEAITANAEDEEEYAQVDAPGGGFEAG